MSAPESFPPAVNQIRMNFPNREELSFLMVLAFPNASKIGLASKICCSIQECFPLIAAKYCKMSFVLSVLPAPDSPEMTTH